MAASLRLNDALSERETENAAQQCRDAGARRVAFSSSRRFNRTYGAFEATVEGSIDRIRAEFPTATIWDFTIIALAIEPQIAEALPFLKDAFGGTGKPAGVLACEEQAGCALLEIREDVTPLELILRLSDLELRRFGNPARRIHAVSPVPLQTQLGLASRGLKGHGLDASRILEVLIGAPYA